MRTGKRGMQKRGMKKVMRFLPIVGALDIILISLYRFDNAW
jgi:hypothetical protein